AHSGLARLLKKEEERRAKAAGSRWHWDEPRFAHPLAQRQLRLCSGLFIALDRRGHGGEVREENEELKAVCLIGEKPLHVEFGIVGRHRTEMRGGYQRPA
ncbi:hypothetical protein, partial [Salmonella enterica]|uniref:hypothetical protein n=1 Tax=Salmonella enterica TaxID=28901 RepID=UPI001C3F1DA6